MKNKLIILLLIFPSIGLIGSSEAKKKTYHCWNSDKFIKSDKPCKKPLTFFDTGNNINVGQPIKNPCWETKTINGQLWYRLIECKQVKPVPTPVSSNDIESLKRVL